MSMYEEVREIGKALDAAYRLGGWRAQLPLISQARECLQEYADKTGQGVKCPICGPSGELADNERGLLIGCGLCNGEAYFKPSEWRMGGRWYW